MIAPLSLVMCSYISCGNITTDPMKETSENKGNCGFWWFLLECCTSRRLKQKSVPYYHIY